LRRKSKSYLRSSTGGAEVIPCDKRSKNICTASGENCNQEKKGRKTGHEIINKVLH